MEDLIQETQSSLIALDLAEYAPPEQFISYLVDNSIQFSATPFKSLSDEPSLSSENPQPSKYNFITFLATAQHREIDFLPVVWDDDLRSAGRGGQASISQSVIDENLSYAYKRIRRQELKCPADEIQAMRALIAEISILGHEKIRGHPNIVRLVGICWDIVSNSEPIWPVLVFQKAEYKDLYWFMSSDGGKQLGARGRLKLCSDVAAAVMLMHGIDIVHGDIKPQNVLIFPDAKMTYVAKVTDFGYSTLDVAQSERITLPRSDPWYAPEVRFDKSYSLLEAKRTDIYSFGLLLLWMISYSGTDDRKSPQAVPMIEKIKNAKEEETIIEFAKIVVNSIAELDQVEKKSLIAFFELTLAQDPSQRTVDLQDSMKSFSEFVIPPLENNGSSMYNMYMPYLSILPRHKDFNIAKAQDEYYGEEETFSWSSLYNPYSSYYAFKPAITTHFRISRSFKQLISSDFRLWGYIFKCLQIQAQSEANDAQYVAFQLAFCHYIGFGTPINEEETNRWLGKCHNAVSLESLQNEVSFVKEDLNPMKYKNLETQIRPLEYLDYYLRSEDLSNIQAVYESSMSNTEKRLGETHPIPVSFRHILGWIHFKKGDYKASYEIHEKTVRIREETLGLHHPDTIKTIDAQYQAAFAGEMHDVIDSLKRKLFDAKRKRPKPAEDRSTIAGLEQLEDGYLAQWRWWEADEAKEQLMEARINEIKKAIDLDSVKKHVDELWESWRSKRPEEARELATKVQEETINSLGEEHAISLIAMDLLASAFEKLEDWDAVQRITGKAIMIRESTLGFEHPDTLRTKNHRIYAALHGKGRDRWSATQCLAQAIEVESRIWGCEHPHTIYALQTMATQLWGWTRDEEVMQMQEEATARARRLDPEYWEDGPGFLASMGLYTWPKPKPKPKSERRPVYDQLIQRMRPYYSPPES
ncbi:kinase-like domain-containing protein [Xylaria scruposa]|nr:kinase-like domain-containing protein [Xylaria scruposa]